MPISLTHMPALLLTHTHQPVCACVCLCVCGYKWAVGCMCRAVQWNYHLEFIFITTKNLRFSQYCWAVAKFSSALRRLAAVAVIGVWQCGKTHLHHINYLEMKGVALEHRWLCSVSHIRKYMPCIQTYVYSWMSAVRYCYSIVVVVGAIYALISTYFIQEHCWHSESVRGSR